MKWKRVRRMDLQAKVIVILVAVILPTFLIVTVAENKLTQPILEDEMRQVGVTSAKNLATEIVSSHLLSLADPNPAVESRMEDVLFSQPNITRVDVLAKDPIAGTVRTVASNIEEDPSGPPTVFPMVDTTTSELKVDDSGFTYWQILVPIERKSRDPRGPKRILGLVHVDVSLKFVSRVLAALWKTTAAAAALSVVTLIVVLSYFLRKTIFNERLLKQAESTNIRLTERLHEAQRELMNSEKLAVMGQLTASFAHEIGTPLNAIGGHLQLLKEDLAQAGAPVLERLEVINGQLTRIEQIVKGFLQSTAKPASQRQLVDVNRLVEKSLGLVMPRVESLGIDVQKKLDREMGPLRIVPLELEQILLNLLNNALDSLKSKSEKKEKSRLQLEVGTELGHSDGKNWAEISVFDTGDGIPREDLKNVLKPFFTTKRPGEGTGLGLTICQQLAHKYGGSIEIDSKEGAWARFIVRVPYEAKV